MKISVNDILKPLKETGKTVSTKIVFKHPKSMSVAI